MLAASAVALAALAVGLVAGYRLALWRERSRGLATMRQLRVMAKVWGLREIPGESRRQLRDRMMRHLGVRHG